MNVTINVYLMSGLPGSGKTYYVKNEILPTLDKKIETIIHFDADYFLYRNMSKYEAYKQTLKSNFSDIMYNIRDKQKSKNIHVIIDGLFLTNSEIHKIVKITKDEFDYIFSKSNTLPIKYEMNFNIHQWNEDREACLANDPSRLFSNGGDRDKNSSAAIKHAAYEQFKIDKFKQEFPTINFNLIKHTVVAYSPFVLADSNGDGLLKSDSWVTGGRWGNYLGDEGELEAEPEEEFTQFDDFVESICPDISHKNYRILWNACVEQKEKQEDQYYGGYEISAYWECNLDKLHNKMIELGLIEK